MSATATIIPADPQVWRKCFLDLRPGVSPCPGLTGANWTAIHAKGVDFLDRWVDEAAALGWTTLDLFGVHPQAGTVRVDFCGALVMSTDLVSGITKTRMRFTNTTFYLDKPGRPAPCRCSCSAGDAHGSNCYSPVMVDTPKAALDTPPPQIFRADDLAGAVDALLANPRARVVMTSEGRSLDVSAAVRADDFASRTLTSLNASASRKRMAVRTAILLARPEKG